MDKITVKNNRLAINGKNVQYVPTPNTSGKMDPKYLVIHFTAGQSAKGAINWMKQKRAKASAHFVLDYNGDLTQMAPMNVTTWHAGRSKWDGINGLNRHSIGIEVVNPGPMKKISEGRYKAWFGQIYDRSEYPDIIEDRHENGGPVMGWLPFSPEQIQVLLHICPIIMDKYDLKECVGHDQIAPRRKVDPGPCLERSFFDLINGREDGNKTDNADGDYEVVNAKGGLNIRHWPSPESKPHDFGPLPNGTKVDIIRRKAEWALVELVDVGHEGWVHTNWLKRS